jgi:ribosomal protein L37AE/L43A
MDPIAQAHIAHRQGQVRRMMNDGRMSRDPILMEKANTLREQMMPEQLKVQMGAMRPMMFTMIFIIGIFAWLTTAVESFRVDYVSLPWTPRWDLLDDKFLFFPAWICAYICMSAPLGRIVDRHIKLIRYRKHPVVLANEKLSEPLLHLVVSDEATESRQAKNRRSKSRKNGPKKQQKNAVETEEKVEVKASKSASVHVCPECMSEDVEKKGHRSLRCNVCYHEWV